MRINLTDYIQVTMELISNIVGQVTLQRFHVCTKSSGNKHRDVLQAQHPHSAHVSISVIALSVFQFISHLTDTHMLDNFTCVSSPVTASSFNNICKGRLGISLL
jgi:hypothetical protein